MSQFNRHRQHKWSGIASAVLLLSCCLSGIILNHRNSVSDYEVSRRWLPSRYEFHNWNGGLLRATLPYHDKILVYGTNGVWITDSTATAFADFNTGLPEAADHRIIRGIVNCSTHCYAATPEAVYKLVDGMWQHVGIPFRATLHRLHCNLPLHLPLRTDCNMVYMERLESQTAQKQPINFLS